MGARTPRRRGKPVARATVTALTVAGLAGTGVTKWRTITASLALLPGHLQWSWLAAALLLELASMAALAGMQRRLLAAGGARVGARSMLATTLAANALSVSVPLAGPELGTAFAFRRFTRQGADSPLAGWSLLAGGMASTGAGALVLIGGGLWSGNILVTTAAVGAGLLVTVVLATAATAIRWTRLREMLEGPAAWTLRHGSRLVRRPVDDPRQAIRAWADRLVSLRLPPLGWITVSGLALANWLADVAVLAVSIHAVGATVPWHVLVLAYGSGVAAQSLNVTPGGVGVAEGTLGFTLAAAGLQASTALAGVLLYRLVSFWLMAGAGWLVFLRLRHRRPPGATN